MLTSKNLKGAFRFIVPDLILPCAISNSAFQNENFWIGMVM